MFSVPQSPLCAGTWCCPRCPASLYQPALSAQSARLPLLPCRVILWALTDSCSPLVTGFIHAFHTSLPPPPGKPLTLSSSLCITSQLSLTSPDSFLENIPTWSRSPPCCTLQQDPPPCSSHTPSCLCTCFPQAWTSLLCLTFQVSAETSVLPGKIADS